jgi:hypothetical protein
MVKKVAVPPRISCPMEDPRFEILKNRSKKSSMIFYLSNLSTERIDTEATVKKTQLQFNETGIIWTGEFALNNTTPHCGHSTDPHTHTHTHSHTHWTLTQHRHIQNCGLVEYRLD